MEKINKLICPKTEDEIKSYWKHTDKVYISCVCIAYNHENYIRDAIGSILAQKSDYRFELIIHDDNSTDKTREIILEYKEKFPNIIKLILQKENQYSKCPRIIPLTVPYLDGDYVTICEGDDFWIDENKINLQYSELTKKDNINICFTSAKSLSNDGSVKLISHHNNEKTIFSSNQVIQGGGHFMPTASIMIKANKLKNLPKWYYTAPVGDYFLQIFASMYNGAIYLPIPSCVYRKEANLSWSSRRRSLSIEKINNESLLYENAFEQIKKEYVSNDIIDNELSNQLMNLSILALRNDYPMTAKELICKSWSKKSKINRKQLFIYRMRNHLYILKILLSIKNKLKL